MSSLGNWSPHDLVETQLKTIQLPALDITVDFASSLKRTPKPARCPLLGR